MALEPQPAVLLLGPTGAGKTPLGEMLEARGLWGRKCLHFDFGANLREVVARDQPDELMSREDIEFLRSVLQSGALLEDEQFPLAERLLQSFLARHAAQRDTWLALNGLPRHVGQARAIEAIVQVRAVICLDCPAASVVQRVANNAGGDRAGRPDDDLNSVCRKLEIFRQRTGPLLDHYQRLGIRVVTVKVASTMAAEALWQSVCIFPPRLVD